MFLLCVLALMGVVSSFVGGLAFLGLRPLLVAVVVGLASPFLGAAVVAFLYC